MVILARAALLFLLCGLKEAAGTRRCGPVGAPRDGAVTCLWGGRRASCRSKLPAGSIAEFSCREFYKLSSEDQSVVKCRRNGSWSSPAPKCIPDCGRRRSAVSLIVHGAVAPRGAFPWHAAIYHLTDENYEYWCGGSLISEVAVVTAAHCMWEIDLERLVVAFGKFHREYDSTDANVQRRRVRRVVMLSSYQDVTGNYNGDVAVVFLQGRVGVGPHSAPVCVDWDQRLVDEQLAEGTYGVVPGWGLTENNTLGDSLRVVRLPVVSDAECIARLERDFKKYVTYTAFCAGFANGTGVCNGDSGGGLVFFDGASGRWYLQGLVSVSPRKQGTPICDLRFYTVFTKVSAFSRWLRIVEKSEGVSWSPGKPDEDPSAKVKLEDFFAPLGEGGGKRFVYPHTKKMLELVQAVNASRKPVS